MVEVRELGKRGGGGGGDGGRDNHEGAYALGLFSSKVYV